MDVLEAVVAAFAICAVTQIILFRFFNPIKPIYWLGIIFIGGLIASNIWFVSRWSLPKIVHLTFFYLAVFGTYLMTYVNTREPGPSFLILRFIKKCGSAERNDLNRVVIRENVWNQRV